MEPKKLTYTELCELGREATADFRSVRRELTQPGSVKGAVGIRVRRVLANAGLLPADQPRAT